MRRSCLSYLQVLECLYKSGKARAIGVSNYNTAHVQELVAAAKVKPMVNQVRGNLSALWKKLPSTHQKKTLSAHGGHKACNLVFSCEVWRNDSTRMLCIRCLLTVCTALRMV